MLSYFTIIEQMSPTVLNVTSRENSKSFLRWAGSKKKLVPTLLKSMSTDFNKYIEPFVGSAQLFFACKPNTAVLRTLIQQTRCLRMMLKSTVFLEKLSRWWSSDINLNPQADYDQEKTLHCIMGCPFCTNYVTVIQEH